MSKKRRRKKKLLSSSIGKIKYFAAIAVCMIVGILVLMIFSHYACALCIRTIGYQCKLSSRTAYFLLVDQQHMNMCISLVDLFLIYVADSYYQVCRVVPQIGNGYIDDGGPGGQINSHNLQNPSITTKKEQFYIRCVLLSDKSFKIETINGQIQRLLKTVLTFTV